MKTTSSAVLTAKELRQGNLLDFDGQIIAVMWILPEDIVECRNVFDGPSFYRLSRKDKDVRYIPLTEEWLLKFGFVRPNNDGVVEYYLKGLQLCFITTDEHYQFCFETAASSIKFE